MNDKKTGDPAPERAKSDDLDVILKRVKWIGPGPEPSEDEVIDLANAAVHEVRARRAENGSQRQS